MIVVLILAFSAAIIVIVVLALETPNSAVPETVDVVLYQSPDTSRMARYLTQSKAVRRYMTWVRKVYLLSQYVAEGEDTALDISVVRFTGSASEAFEYMPSISGIADHAIFLSDMTVPFREVQKQFMFFQGRPRMFNIFRDQAEVEFFAPYLELPTMPVLVTALSKLRAPPPTWQDLVFREATEENVVNREVNPNPHTE